MGKEFGAIILAAGLAERFGSPKIMVDWMGKPLVAHVVESVLACDFSEVIVVLGAVIDPAQQALSGYPVNIVHNTQYRSGLGTSFSLGVQSIQDGLDGCFIFLCDHPFIDGNLVEHMKSISDHPDVLVPTNNGRPGHPVLWKSQTFSRIRQMDIGESGRSLQSEFHVLKVPWCSKTITSDIDTPSDYDRMIKSAQEDH